MTSVSEKSFTCLRAVVLDWAGTTVDFGCQGPVQAFVDGFASDRVVVTAAEARGPMGREKRDHVATMFAVPRIADVWRAEHGRAWKEEDVDRVYLRVEALMNESIRNFSTPISGVTDMIARLRAGGLGIGSCTGYPRSVAAPLAERARELGYAPDVLVCSSDVPRSRPHPDMCLRVLSLLNVEEPWRAVKIGDTVNDVLEGTAAGMWVVGITLSGSMAGLSEDEMNRLSEAEKQALHEKIATELAGAGAHFSVSDLASVLPVLRKIDAMCAQGYKPADMAPDAS
jgi:phosphonoacetaldehyde hydrolase